MYNGVFPSLLYRISSVGDGCKLWTTSKSESHNVVPRENIEFTSGEESCKQSIISTRNRSADLFLKGGSGGTDLVCGEAISILSLLIGYNYQVRKKGRKKS